MFKGSIVALVTPFTENGEVDYKLFSSLVERQVSEGTDALVCCGTTGEAPTLSVEEQLRLIQITVEVAKKRVPVIAGTGCNDTRLSVKKTEEAKRVGVDACQVIVPYYNRPTPEGCYRHFQEIAKVGLPIQVYHHPGRTGVKLSVEDLSRLATIPEVISFKEASSDLKVMRDVIAKIHKPIFTGDDLLTLEALEVGAKGSISVIANLIPAVWKKVAAGDAMLFKKYEPLVKAVLLETNPQGIKYAMSLMGLCSPHLRLPLIEPGEETRRALSALQGTLLPAAVRVQ